MKSMILWFETVFLRIVDSQNARLYPTISHSFPSKGYCGGRMGNAANTQIRSCHFRYAVVDDPPVPQKTGVCILPLLISNMKFEFHWCSSKRFNQSQIIWDTSIRVYVTLCLANQGIHFKNIAAKFRIDLNRVDPDDQNFITNEQLGLYVGLIALFAWLIHNLFILTLTFHFFQKNPSRRCCLLGDLEFNDINCVPSECFEKRFENM